MSRVYDNWERLVGAVLKKQQLWELFHSPSLSSISSDFTSSSSFHLTSEDDISSNFTASGSSPFLQPPRFLQVLDGSLPLGRAGSFRRGPRSGLLEQIMTNLNSSGGANRVSILTFELANTIVKGFSLMQSLSEQGITQLKESVLAAKGIQRLITEDMDELLSFVADDKRDELKAFSGEVVRFGNLCMDPQWRNLDLFFQGYHMPRKQLRKAAELFMQQLMTLVPPTAELYQELNALDRLENDYQQRLEELRFSPMQRGNKDGILSDLAKELKSKRKLVKGLKKKSLWSRSLVKVVKKLVDIVAFLSQEINNTFGNPVRETSKTGSLSDQKRLGPAGLALHYANIILQIDSIVAVSSRMPPNARDTLYQSLPPSVKSSLKFALRSFCVTKELTLDKIKDEITKTLQWLVPIAMNTTKACHGLSWVAEWASTGYELDFRPVGAIDILRVETLHHADRQKTEEYILYLVLWLNYLVMRSMAGSVDGGTFSRPSFRSLARLPLQKPVTVHSNLFEHPKVPFSPDEAKQYGLLEDKPKRSLGRTYSGKLLHKISFGTKPERSLARSYSAKLVHKTSFETVEDG